VSKAIVWLEGRVGTSAPIWTAFVGSLLLSLVSVLGSDTLNHDGMLYVDAARNFLREGYSGLFGTFDWPTLSLLMAVLSKLTGLGLEPVGHAINALFLAGTCGLMVDLVRRRQPEAAWIACLVVLSIPGVNGYRDQLLREYGCWFFSVLAFWWVINREQDCHRWPEALLCQVLLIFAVLFRFEAVMFFPALAVWQLVAAPRGGKLGRAFNFVSIPVTCGVVLIFVFATGIVAVPSRLMEYLDAVNAFGSSKLAQHAAKLVEAAILPKYSNDEARFILFFGLLAVVPLKFFSAVGVFGIPLFYGFLRRPVREYFDRWAPLPWAFLAHLVALCGFAIQRLFVLARHAGPLALLAIPAIADGTLQLQNRFPKWRLVILAAAFLSMADSVISVGAGHSHVSQAGAWIEKNVTESNQVFIEDVHVAYRAGWRLSDWRREQLSRPQIEAAVADGKFSLLVLSQSRKKAKIDEWISQHGWRVVMRFENGAGDAVIVVEIPNAATHRPGDSTSADSSAARSAENTTSMEYRSSTR
jgi:hypothetical protein